MSFKRGDIIKYKTSFWDGEFGEPQDIVGKLGVIKYSYNEKYGNKEYSNNYGYSVINLDTGYESAWWHENQLEFIGEGGEHIIEECKNKTKIRKEQLTNLKWIKENWKQNNNISALTILTLFNEIKYNSSFNQNGEYIILFDDWVTLSPIFKAIFNNDYEEMIKSINEIFKSKFIPEKIKLCTSLFNKIKVL